MPNEKANVSLKQKEKLFRLALSAREQAYCVYSQFAVGASVLFDDGSYASGSNIENASYGATVCAERVAIWSGIKENKKRRIVAVCVVTDQEDPWPPCGQCLQVISEFALPTTTILMGNLKGLRSFIRFLKLWEHPFAPQFLQVRD
ncbi:MAG: cytidine deaminase [Bdellovibrionaceae bacterium]|nr:cytidine deaminase [Pseudobdellovibrionaceae bacterium]MDW8190481.1 cytidine deaminase [Pseudobdellovibrionaceae bacterium]